MTYVYSMYRMWQPPYKYAFVTVQSYIIMYAQVTSINIYDVCIVEHTEQDTPMHKHAFVSTQLQL